MKKLLIAGAALLALVSTGVVYAQQASDYNFATSLTVSNQSGSTLTDALVPFDMNWNSLVDDSYLASDGQDILILSQSGGTEALHIAQATTADPARWWVKVDSLADNATGGFTIYTGQNTTAADNPQSIYISNVATTTGDITGTLGGVANIALYLDSFTIDALPSSGNVSILATTNAAQVYLSSAGTLTGSFTNSGGGTCLVTKSLSVDTDYDLVIKAISGIGSTGTCTIGPQNNPTENSANFGAPCCGGELNSRAASFTIGGTAGFKASLGDYRAYDLDSNGNQGTPIFELEFEPPHMTETQEGTAGNSWTWKSSIQDQSVSNNDGTWTHVQDTTGITTTLGPIEPVNTASASNTSENNPEFVDGTVNTPIGDPYVEGTTDADFGFPLNILAISADAGSIPLQLLAGTIVAVGAILAGFGAYRLTSTPAAATFSAMVVAGALIYVTTLPNIGVVMMVIALTAATFMIDRPLESRG